MLIQNKLPFIEGLILNEGLDKRYEVIDVGWGTSHTVFLVRSSLQNDLERKLLAWGYHNCLGNAEISEDTYKLQTIKIPDLEDYDKIEFLIVKFNSSAVLDDENNLYYWGDDYDGFRAKVPESKVFFDERIVDISFGFKHVIALTESGTVYTWGDGTYGELGNLTQN